MKKISLYIMSLFYFTAGVNHLWHPLFYVKIMPPWIGYHEQLVFISGLCEMLLGILLLFQKTRNFAAWGVVALLVMVFPANIQMMLNYLHEQDPKLWIAVLRLPIQIILIMWAYSFTKNKYPKQGIK